MVEIEIAPYPVNQADVKNSKPNSKETQENGEQVVKVPNTKLSIGSQFTHELHLFSSARSMPHLSQDC